MNVYLRRLLALGLLLCLLPLAAQAKRIALVMGNDKYQHVAQLQKAGNDAVAMAAELRSAGFEVVLHRDLNYRGMVKAMESLYNSIAGGDEVVVFFAGHGVQIKSGSFLLPTDIEATSESEVEKTSYALNDLMEHLAGAKAAFALVLVDACRDNPLRSRGRNLGMVRGLNPPDPPKGQMVVYSASRGQQALDRLHDRDANPNSVFTREFIARMRRPGLRVDELVREIQDSVETLARSVSHEQRPALYNEARGNFYFYAPPTGTAAAPAAAVTGSQAADEARREDRFWEDAKAAGNREGYEAYLDQYRNGRYASLARANINRLSGAGSAAATQVVAAAPAAARQAPPAATPAPPSPVPAAPTAAAAPAAAADTAGAVVAALTARSTRTRVTLPNGDRYEGDVIGVTRTGSGTYTFANGDKYEGEFVDNLFHGKGTQAFASGDVYVGDFQRGFQTGRGVYTFADGARYEGEFVQNQFHGKGKHSFKSGDTYEGEFVRGIKQGPGVYRFANGDRFEGDFAENLFNGRGRMNFANGDRYEGEFRNSAKEGQGTHYFANNERYEGTFRAGVQAGAGTHFYANGDKYTGQFANGVRHGKGVYTFANGQVKELEFDKGSEKSN